MRRVFISQVPLKDLTKEEITDFKVQAFIMANDMAGSEEVRIVNNTIDDRYCDDSIWSLSNSLEILSQCDIAVFPKGWENYRQCKLEYTSCVEFNIKVIVIK